MNSTGYSPGKCNDRTFSTVLFRAKISHEIIMPEDGTASLSLPAATKECSIFGRCVQQMMKSGAKLLTQSRARNSQFCLRCPTLPSSSSTLVADASHRFTESFDPGSRVLGAEDVRTYCQHGRASLHYGRRSFQTHAAVNLYFKVVSVALAANLSYFR